MKYILIAVILDLILGDPYSFPHPVKLMGRIISLEEKNIRKFNKIFNLKFAGLLITILNISLAFTLPYFLLKMLKQSRILYSIVNIYLMYTCIAARCLDKEAMKVYNELDNGIEGARTQLS